MEPSFASIYAKDGRPSIPPGRLLRALLLQALFSVRSERQLMEQLTYNLLYRWFVGLAMDGPVWDVTCSRRTVTGCWRATSRAGSSARFWRTRRSSRCCRRTISRSMER